MILIYFLILFFFKNAPIKSLEINTKSEELFRKENKQSLIEEENKYFFDFLEFKDHNFYPSFRSELSEEEKKKIKNKYFSRKHSFLFKENRLKERGDLYNYLNNLILKRIFSRDIKTIQENLLKSKKEIENFYRKEVFEILLKREKKRIIEKMNRILEKRYFEKLDPAETIIDIEYSLKTLKEKGVFSLLFIEIKKTKKEALKSLIIEEIAIGYDLENGWLDCGLRDEEKKEFAKLILNSYPNTISIYDDDKRIAKEFYNERIIDDLLEEKDFKARIFRIMRRQEEFRKKDEESFFFISNIKEEEDDRQMSIIIIESDLNKSERLAIKRDKQKKALYKKQMKKQSLEELFKTKIIDNIKMDQVFILEESHIESQRKLYADPRLGSRGFQIIIQADELKRKGKYRYFFHNESLTIIFSNKEFKRRLLGKINSGFPENKRIDLEENRILISEEYTDLEKGQFKMDIIERK